MVVAAVRTEPARLPADVDDSKRLTPERRTEIAAALRADDAVALAVITVDPPAIDAPASDMNTLTVRGHARAAGQIVRPGDRVVADAGDTSESRFASRLASTVAKVARDARIEAIDRTYPAYESVGSGYPSDPTTRAFLRAYVGDHGDVPPHARRSWTTCADVLAAAEQSALDEF
jgi:ribonuclease HII